MQKIQILLIEDNRLMRDGIAAMLKKQIDMQVVAVSIDEKLFTTKNKATIVLLDLGLLSQNNLHIIKIIKERSPEIKVIIINLIPLQTDIIEFVQAGVSGFILKEASSDEFVKTIRSVNKGVQVLPQRLTGSLFSQIVGHTNNGSKPSTVIDAVHMSKREQEVIDLIADGSSNNEIALSLHLSIYTVKSHVHNILNKLAINTRVQISKYAHLSIIDKTPNKTGL